MTKPTEKTSPEIHLKRESCWPEILKRVPASQLSSCLAVSKTWYSLITSSAFIWSHTNTTFMQQNHQESSENQQSSKLFIIKSFIMKNPIRIPKEHFHICSDGDEQTLETLTKRTLLCPFRTRTGMYFRFVGCVNGVVFLSDDWFGNNYEFILWNPLVGCFVKLPKPRGVDLDGIGRYVHVLGVGYDGVSDDFKVVRVVYMERGDGVDETPPRAELYSVKEGEWRWVSADSVEYCVVEKPWTQCSMKGSVHWVAYERGKVEDGSRHKTNVLLLFNFEKEKFLMMKLPDELREVSPIGLSVFESKGMLCVNHLAEDEMVYTLWVKKEYNKGKSWCKVASVDQRCTSFKIAIYWRKNGDLLAFTEGRQLISYNPVTGNVVTLAPGCCGLYDACSFVGSLAFLNKDCKNMRRFLPVEDVNDSSGVERISADTLTLTSMARSDALMYQMQKLRREF